MSDNGTLRDYLADVINERNELLRKVETMQAQIDELSRQLAALWKVESDRNRWRATAEVLARELGKVEYANAEWHNQEGLH